MIAIILAMAISADLTPAQVDAYRSCRESEIKRRIETVEADINDALSSLRNREITSAARQTHKRALATARKKLAELKKGEWDGEPVLQFPPTVGKVGVLGAITFDVIDVDKRLVLVQRAGTSGPSDRIIVRNIDVSDLASGRSFHRSGVFEVIGTQKTGDGETVMVLEPFDAMAARALMDSPKRTTRN